MNDDPALPEENNIATTTAWWVKRDAGPMSHDDRASFEAWLAMDSANRAAFDEVSILCGELRALRLNRAPMTLTPARRRSWLIPSSALLAASLTLLFMFDDRSIRWRADFHTGTSETRW
jgi:transmembrane sensor